MHGKRLINSAVRAGLGCLALGGALVSTQAHAQVIGVAVQPAIASAVVQSACADLRANRAPIIANSAVPNSVRASKSAAILGGEMSALERMRMQQTQQETTVAVAAPTIPVEPLQPAASGHRYCASVAVMPALKQASFTVRPSTGDDFLASKRVRIGKTNFDRDWRRVKSERVSSKAHLVATQAPVASEEFIAAVNRWVNQKIAYVEDSDLFGKADYWAGARLTLTLGKGDCEDYALTKMQLLAAAGIPQSDMYLTIARDTVRRVDHALLVVKLEDRYVVLDNATDELLDGAYNHDYAPVLSFSGEKSWLHGY